LSSFISGIPSHHGVSTRTCGIFNRFCQMIALVKSSHICGYRVINGTYLYR
jgi:hypothetical protein